jgi:hypothetical protein
MSAADAAVLEAGTESPLIADSARSLQSVSERGSKGTSERYVRCHNAAGEICIVFGCDPPGHAYIHVHRKAKQRWVDGLTRFDKTGQLSLRSEGGYKTFTWGWILLTHQSEHSISRLLDLHSRSGCVVRLQFGWAKE